MSSPLPSSVSGGILGLKPSQDNSSFLNFLKVNGAVSDSIFSIQTSSQINGPLSLSLGRIDDDLRSSSGFSENFKHVKLLSN